MVEGKLKLSSKGGAAGKALPGAPRGEGAGLALRFLCFAPMPSM